MTTRFPRISLSLTLVLCTSVLPAQSKPQPGKTTDAKIVPAGEGGALQPGVKQLPKPTIQRAPFDGPRPNRWFDATQLDLGTFLEGETAVGKFRFTNPDDAEHVLRNISPNCQCARAKVIVGGRTYLIENSPVPNTIYRLDGPEVPEDEKTNATPKTKVKHIAVGGHEEGFVEMHLSLKGVTGIKEAFISMRTDDPLLPAPRVIARAKGVNFFTVRPPQINLNKMTWDEKREFSFEVSSDIKPDFEVTDITTAAEALIVTSKEKTVRGDQTVWKVSGQYGPDVNPRAGGGVLKIDTDVRDDKGGPGKSLEVRVIAVVDGPMTVRPGAFLPLGRVRQKQGTSKFVEFEPNNDFDLQFGAVELENVTEGYADFVKFKTTKEGKILKLELQIAPGAPSGLVRGDVKVGLNHPAIPFKSLQFNGFVR